MPAAASAELQERGRRVEQRGDPVPGQQLTAGHVPLAGPLRAAPGRVAEPLAQAGGERGVRRGVAPELRAVRVGQAGQLGRIHPHLPVNER